jgi:hypothetical protein
VRLCGCPFYALIVSPPNLTYYPFALLSLLTLLHPTRLFSITTHIDPTYKTITVYIPLQPRKGTTKTYIATSLSPNTNTFVKQLTPLPDKNTKHHVIPITRSRPFPPRHFPTHPRSKCFRHNFTSCIRRCSYHLRFNRSTSFDRHHPSCC